MEPLQEVAIGLCRPNGEALVQVAVTQQSGDEYLASVVVPDETFRVYVLGKDATGHTIQRAESATVSPQRFFVEPLQGSMSVWPGDRATARFRLENRGQASKLRRLRGYG